MKKPTHTKGNAESWAEVFSAFEHCCELSGQERAKYLTKLAVTAPALHAEVKAMLEEWRSPQTFFDRPILQGIAEARGIAGEAEPSSASTGKYLLLEQIGRGGMAEIFLAVARGDAGFQRLFAVKRTLPDITDEGYSRELFEYEARLGGMLIHPNIVPVYDFCQTSQGYLLAMEYVRGRNLVELEKKAAAIGSPVPRLSTLYIAIECCRGLDYVHCLREGGTGEALGIIHRDISPKNIMITFLGEVKILDFGIAKFRNRETFTDAGAFRGTIAYMAPEALIGAGFDHRSDLFSLCLVLYELLAGARLFDQTSPTELIDAIRECELPSVKVAELNVPESLRGVLLRGLAKEPANRYPSAKALESDLIGALEELHPNASRRMLVDYMQANFSEERLSDERRVARVLKRATEVPPLLPASARGPTEAAGEKAGKPRTAPTIHASKERDPAPHRYGMMLALALVLGGGVFLSRPLQKQPAPLSLQPSAPPQSPRPSAAAKAPPPGTLELMFTRNAKVFDGGNLIAEVAAGEKIKLSVPANRDKEFRFVNERLGLDVHRHFRIESGQSLAVLIDLDEK